MRIADLSLWQNPTTTPLQHLLAPRWPPLPSLLHQQVEELVGHPLHLVVLQHPLQVGVDEVLRQVVVVDHRLQVAVVRLAGVVLLGALAGGPKVDVHPHCLHLLATVFILTIRFRGAS